MTSVENAIGAEEADRAFECLKAFDVIVLAVSGGPDSVALLSLVAEWAARSGSNCPEISVATVDHGLRAASAEEARVVAEFASAAGLKHTTLPWTGAKPLSGVPNAARAARYDLLDGYTRSITGEGRAALVTAHHLDDQAETVFMRLARGGGVAALAAMPSDRPLSKSSSVRLVRPLLGFSKSRLVATVARRGLEWVDDPTNSDPTFERPRVRDALASSGLAASALAATARRMQDAADGLAFAVAAFETSLDIVNDRAIYVRFDRTAFDDGPVILRQMVLARLIGFFGGATTAPELSEIENLAARFGRGGDVAATLGGAMISGGSRYVRLWREPERVSTVSIRLRSDESVVWDDRFLVGYTLSVAVGVDPGDIDVRPLGQAASDSIRAEVKGVNALPAAAVAGLPGFFAGGHLMAVPLLGIEYRPTEGLNWLCVPMVPSNDG